MGNYLDKDGLTRFKEKMLTEVDKRIATGGGSSSGGDVPTKEEIIEGATRVTDVEVNPEVAQVQALQTGLARVESNLESLVNAPSPTAYITNTWSNGVNWYRVWSDGWIEQGGCQNATSTSNHTLTVTFPIAFSSTPLDIRRTPCVDGSRDIGTSHSVYIKTVSATNCTFYATDKNYINKYFWYACGY